MSFNTGGHTVYVRPPAATSAPHITAESNGTVLVFTDVAGEAEGQTERVGTLFPERVVGGRIVG